MISKLPTVKGMVFAGCSFTWGQGLHYYRNTDTIKEPDPNQFSSELLTTSHYDYIKKFRYPRLVADHFNTTEFVRKDNGGNNEQIVEWFDSILFHNNKTERHFHDNYYQCSEFSHLFYQFTIWSRSNFQILGEEFFGDESNERFIKTLYIPYPSLTYEEKYKKALFRYLEKHHLTIDEFLDQQKQSHINYVKQWLQKVEQHGIKVYVLNWQDEITDNLLEDDWISKRYIPFKYKNKIWNDIQKLTVHNPEMTIHSDTNNFIETPKDHHPSKLCHKIIADNIIDRLIQDGYKGT